VVRTAAFVAPFAAIAVIAYVPFYISFESQADGLWPAVEQQQMLWPSARPIHALLYWGPLFVIVVPFVVARLYALRARISAVAVTVALVLPAAVIGVWMVYFVIAHAAGAHRMDGGTTLASQITDRGEDWITDIGFALLLSASVLALWLEVASAQTMRSARAFALLLTSVAMLLVLGTEFFYIGDIFNTRVNTVFKLYYQAWVLLSLASAIALYELFVPFRWPSFARSPARLAWAGALVLVAAGAALYTVGAPYNRVRPYSESGELLAAAGEIRGLAWMPPDEQAAIRWLDDRAQGQHFVIAESVMEKGGKTDYSSAGRFSETTGIPTILGWPSHEDQWRGGNANERAGRREDVVRLYNGKDLDVAKAVLAKYGVRYLIVGDVERKAYPADALAKFDAFPVAFRSASGSVVIYDVGG
jgi:uncharacterized membrane protein